MKVNLKFYMHAENGLSLELVPESDIERGLLAGLWCHGKLNPDIGPAGFLIQWKPEAVKPVSTP